MKHKPHSIGDLEDEQQIFLPKLRDEDLKTFKKESGLACKGFTFSDIKISSSRSEGNTVSAKDKEKERVAMRTPLTIKRPL